MDRLTPEAIRATVFDCIRAVAPEADFDALRADKSWREQLEVDSFDFQNVLAALEAKLDIAIPERDYARLERLDRLLDYVAARLA
jgi:acyl carrier protein